MGRGVSVVLEGAESASGLADLLHQYLEQTLEASEEKRRAAERLRGAVTVLAVEDSSVRVRVTFGGERIDIADSERATWPWIKGDFLSVAHLLSGEESMGSLLLGRKLSVRCGPGDALFLWRVSELLKIQEPRAGRGVAIVLVVAAVLAVTLWFVFR